MPLDLSDLQLTDLARELYEADATYNQRVVGGAFALEHWDNADPATQARWINVARAALAFLPRK